MILRYSILIIILVNIITVSCNQKGSLSFVIDDTESMQTDIDQVTDAADRIMDIVLQKNSSQIQDIVLVTFNDPEFITKLRCKTRDKQQLRRSLSSIRAFGGKDCPEYSMSGIKMALDKSYQNSYLFVFTDASPKDKVETNNIKRLAQRKESQIVFIVTPSSPRCSEADDLNNFNYYYEIAASTFGQVFMLDDKIEVEQVLHYVDVVISGDTAPLVSVPDISPNTLTNVSFTIDDQTKYIIVSTSGTNIELDIIDNNRPKRQDRIKSYEKITWIRNAKVVKLSNLKPGTYNVAVKGTGVSSVIIFGRTDFLFQHGFSETEPPTFNNYVKLPTDGEKYHLLISVTDPAHSVDIQTAEILTKDGKSLQNLTLRHKSGEYYTTDLFSSPNSVFLIAIKGIVRKTGEHIQRVARTPIETQPRSYAPILGKREVIKVRENYPATITCNIIKAYPEPTIIWYIKKPTSNNFRIIRGKNSKDLKIQKAALRDTGMYKCIAHNSKGNGEQETELVVLVEPKITVLINNKETSRTAVAYGSGVSLVCQVISHSPPTIIWRNSKYEQIEPTKNEILKSFVFKSYLTITCMKSNESYYCQVDNGFKKAEKHVQVTVESPFQIKASNSTVNVDFEESAVLRCNIKSNSLMQLNWYRIMDQLTLEKKEVIKTSEKYFISKDGTSLLINNVKADEEGKYICEAWLVENKEMNYTIYQDVSINSVAPISGIQQKITMHANHPVKITCNTGKAYPEPTITWYIKKPESIQFEMMIGNSRDLEIEKADLQNTGVYKCIANNSKGSGEQETELVVLIKPRITVLVNNVEVSRTAVAYGSVVSLVCQVTSHSSPTIIWKNGKHEQIIPNKTEILKPFGFQSYLTINNMKLNESYYCQVDNGIKKAEKHVQVIVESPFQINASDPTTNVDFEESAVLRCNIKSNSLMQINWYRIRDLLTPEKKEVIKTSDKYIISKDGTSLLINNVKADEEGKYMCVAWLVENKEMNYTIYQDVSINSVAPISGEREKITVHENHPVKITCNTGKAYPEPTITWYIKKPESIQFEMMIGNSRDLEIEKADLQNTGVYKCIANNSKGSGEQETELVVLIEPRITVLVNNVEMSRIAVAYGSVVSLVCQVTSHSSPTIIWKNGKHEQIIPNKTEILKPFGFQSYLTINNIKLNESYYCQVDNGIKKAEKHVQVIVESPFQINASDPTTNVDFEESAVLRCNIKSNSLMQINWYRIRDLLTPEKKEVIKTSDKYIISKDGTSLLINNVKADEEGKYMCVAWLVENKEMNYTIYQDVSINSVAPISGEREKITVHENHPVKITCNTGKAYPEPTITWYIKKPESIQFEMMIGNSRDLEIEKADLQNTGVYKCIANNSKGSGEQETELVVLIEPRITVLVNNVEMSRIAVAYGSVVSLVCQVTSHSSPTIIWKNGKHEQIIPNKTEILKPFGFQSYLTINNMKLNVSYYCQVDNGIKKAEKHVQVIVESPFQVNASDLSINVEFEESALLHCNIKSNYRMQINWYRIRNLQTTQEKVDVIKTSDKYIISKDRNSLQINNVKADEEGKYMCVAWLVENVDMNHTIYYDVRINSVAPISGKRQKITVHEKHLVKITCNIGKAYPEPTITWYIKKHESNRFENMFGNSRIIDIEKADLQNTGVYKCIANNSKGSGEQETELVVLIEPRITVLVNNTEKSITVVAYGSGISLVCQVTSHSSPLIIWKNGKHEQIKSNKTESLSPFELKSYLTINNMKLNESYYCHVDNGIKKAEKHVQVTVKSPFQINASDSTINVDFEESAVLRCNIKSNHRLQINWYRIMDLLTLEKKEVIKTSDKYIISKDGTLLQINNVKADEEGKYMCVAWLVENVDMNHTIYQDVRINSVAPISGERQKITVHENHPVMITCNIGKAYPEPTITWYIKKPESIRFAIINGNIRDLEIEKADLQNTGVYKCIANNSKGSGEQETELVVLIEPRITVLVNNTEKSKIAVAYGSGISVLCQVTSHSSPTIIWKNGKHEQLKPNKTETLGPFGYNSYLTMSNIKFNQSYYCEVENDMNKTKKHVLVNIESPFKVINNSIKHVKYQEEARLKCGISTDFSMEISWSRLIDKLEPTAIIQNTNKYFISDDGTELKIYTVGLDMQGKYICQAALVDDKSVQAVHTTDVVIIGLEKPLIKEQVSVMKVRNGTKVVLKCKILKGSPEPTVNWLATHTDLNTFQALNQSGEEFVLENSQYEDTGIYKCEANNIAGKDEKYIYLTIEGPPVIVSDEYIVYSAVEGDLVLRVPCVVHGYPKPNITWFKDWKDIKLGNKYNVDDGTLVLKEPLQNDSSKNYTCKAENEFGSDAKSFEIDVEEYIRFDNDFGKYNDIYLLEGETREFDCPVGSENVRWFKEWLPINITGKMTISDANETIHAGNYTCRTSNELGSKSHTFAVDVGYPPRFIINRTNPTIDWNGTPWELDCTVSMQPFLKTVKIEWTYNNEILNVKSESLKIMGFGNHSCKIRNYHGEVNRTFIVTSMSYCLVKRNYEVTSPLLLDINGKWPKIATAGEYFSIKKGLKVLLSCHNQPDSHNSFKNLTGNGEIFATCESEDKFLVDEKLCKFSDLQCTSQVRPIVRPTGIKCASGNTDTVTVGYNIGITNYFLELYSVCFDKDKKVPLYTKVAMQRPQNLSPISYDVDLSVWKSLDYKEYNNGNDLIQCNSSTCCVEKGQMVHELDVGQGPAQSATYINGLNSVLIWKDCVNNVSWSAVENGLRSRLKIRAHFNMYTGAHGYTDRGDGVLLPRYLWKLIKLGTVYAVVRVNDPNPTKKDIFCNTTCPSWLPHDKFTYCCNLSELQRNVFVPYIVK